VRQHLKTTPDLSRALSRLGLGRGGPRDLAAIRQALNNLPNLLSSVGALKEAPSLLTVITEGLQGFEKLQALLDGAVAESDLPLLARDGGFIKEGYDTELEKYRSLNNSSLEVLQKLERTEAEALGVSSLKIKYNKVWGYFIEVTKANADKAPSHYIHRQTTTNAQRFTTPELIDLEKELSSAESRAQEKELSLFDELVCKVCAEANPLLKAAHALATLDVLTATADLAAQRKHIRPTMSDDRTFDIQKGRHPVVENTVETFMPNNCDLSGDALWLLTGPNMAGKSTFLRQNALLAILAHAGFYVPAKKAEIGVVDRIFTRVGAADDLARGQSTFMVEMVE
jgi:DNA mismatch repair protein MutS